MSLKTTLLRLQDSFLGGGIPVGSVVLILDENARHRQEGEEEDGLVDYSRLFLKYFLSEGVASGNDVFHASCGHLGADRFLDALPDVVVKEEEGEEEDGDRRGAARGEDDRLKIAWRYKRQSPRHAGEGSDVAASSAHRFNLNRPMDRGRMEKVDSHVWTPSQPHRGSDLEGDGDRFRELYRRLRELMTTRAKYSPKPQVW